MGVAKSIEQINSEKPNNSRLTALSFSHKKENHRMRYFNCVCTCGKYKVVAISEIITGGTLSCGCLPHENLIKRNTKYINNNHEINVCYLDMIRRCYDVNCKNYKWYGLNGVTVCDEWRNNYQSFLNWALENGWEKGLHLDKDIKNKGNKVYSPENCMFVPQIENLKASGERPRNKKGIFTKT